MVPLLTYFVMSTKPSLRRQGKKGQNNEMKHMCQSVRQRTESAVGEKGTKSYVGETRTIGRNNRTRVRVHRKIGNNT